MDNTIIIVSGGFDPIHKGHIEHIQEAAKLGKVIIALNSDDRLTKKKGKPFMSRDERKIIMQELKSVSEVIAFNDDDGSACDAIRKVASYYQGSGSHIVFAKGGDRTAENIPEIAVCKELNVEIRYSIGHSGKIQSSSRLLQGRNGEK